MSSNLETLKDKIHPSKRKTSEKEKEKEKKKEEEEEEEEDEEEEEEEDDEEPKPVKKEEKKPVKKEEKKPEKKEEKKPEKKPEVKEVKKEEKKPEKKEEKKPVKKEEEEEEDEEEEEEEDDEEEEQPKKKEEKKPEKKPEKADVHKKEEKKEKPKEDKKTDFTPLINELKKLKTEGNDLYNKNSYEEAIKKYQEGYDKIKKELPKIEKEHNPQSDELLTLYKQISSNLSSCYTKLGKYQESIDLDLKIIELDPQFDKAYARLFNNYMKLDKKDQALIYGESLLKFDDETKKKYQEEIIGNISKLKSELKLEKPKKKKSSFCSKCLIPLLILLIAVGVYLYFYKKEETLKYADDLKKNVESHIKHFKNNWKNKKKK